MRARAAWAASCGIVVILANVPNQGLAVPFGIKTEMSVTAGIERVPVFDFTERVEAPFAVGVFYFLNFTCRERMGCRLGAHMSARVEHCHAWIGPNWPREIVVSRHRVIQKHDGSACDHIVGGGLAAVPNFQRHFEDRRVGGLRRLVGVPQFAIGDSDANIGPQLPLGGFLSALYETTSRPPKGNGGTTKDASEKRENGRVERAGIVRRPLPQSLESVFAFVLLCGCTLGLLVLWVIFGGNAGLESKEPK